MPKVHPSGIVVGEVTKEAADETGLQKGTPVVTGGHDYCCTALAVGVVEVGDFLNCAGTSDPLALVMDKPLLTKKLGKIRFPCEPHVVKGKYTLRGTVTSSGMIIEWLKTVLNMKEKIGKEIGEKTVYETLYEQAQLSAPGAQGLFLVPHFYGSGTPPYNPTDKGLLGGLTAFHTKADIIRAVLEGVSYELRLNIELMEKFAGRKIHRITITGGGSKSDFQVQLRADITGKEFEVVPTEQSASLGAAILAGIGIGIYKNEKDALNKIHIKKRIYHPNPRFSKRYSRYYRKGYVPIYKNARKISRIIFELSETSSP